MHILGIGGDPMPKRRFRRPLRCRFRLPRLTAFQSVLLSIGAIFLSFLILLIPATRYFHTLTGAMALSDATDRITKTVNDIVEEKMRDPAQEYSRFINLEKNSTGGIAAIVTDMTQVNTLASELMNSVVMASEQGELDLEIPLGNLLGSGFLLGRGPDVPVKVTMLTSSGTRFRNELTEAGINQTKHQLLLELLVDIDVLLPWEILSTQVVVEVLVAETVIVGQVPQTYVSFGE